MVLILVLWVLVVLAALAIALAQNTKMDNAIRIAAGDRVIARWLARAGVDQALQVLADDDRGVETPQDPWYDNPEVFEAVTLTGGHFDVCADRLQAGEQARPGIVDEASKLNLNTASRSALLALPQMTEPLADALLQYRRPQAADGQASGGSVVAATAAAEAPDQAQPGQVATLRELVQAYPIDPAVFFGEDSNLNGILETNENDGDLMPPADNHNGVLDRGLLAHLTVYSFEYNVDARQRPRLNLNTAGPMALMLELDLTAGQAKWIIENRMTGFDTIADLLEDNASLANLEVLPPPNRTTTPAQPARTAAAPERSARAATPVGKADPATTASDAEVDNAQATDAQAVPDPLVEASPEQLDQLLRQGPDTDLWLLAWSKVIPEPPDVPTFRRIADRITVTDAEQIPGRINVNTAAAPVLRTLPGVDGPLAEALLERRRSLPDGFVSIAELLTVKGMTVATFKQMAPLVTVRSNVFTIRSRGHAERTGLLHWVEAVVVRGPDGFGVIYWREDR